jgi:dipeptidase E
MKIVAIGGGEIGRPGKRIETEKIDKEIIKLSGKKHPRLLFLPTASGDSKSYYEVIQNYYGRRLGCETDVLYLFGEVLSKKEMRKRVLDSDIIYVGGGNTMRMLKLWRKRGLDVILKEALNKNIVLSGVSAGAICWFKYGNSDSLKFTDKRNPLVKLRGLDFVSLMVCPHYNVERIRRLSLRRMVKQKGGSSIALENCSALEIVENKYRIIASSGKAKAYRVYMKSGKVVEDVLESDGEFRNLDELR